MKCEVLKDVRLVVKKGSIIEVEPFQYELARHALKPLKEEKVEKKTTKKK